jgi:hypothetical protein
MRNFKTFAAVAALIVCGAGAAAATPMTYDFSGIATGTLADNAFDTTFDVLVTGDTSGVELLSPGTYANGTVGFGNPSAGPVTFSITLTGLGVFSVTDPGYIFNLAQNGLGGFGSSTDGDFAYMSAPGLTGYELTTSLGPIAVTGTAIQHVETSGGDLAFSTFSDTTFVANAGGGVPEPAAWAMMLVGFGGLGAVMRRRRAAAAFTA